MELQHLFDSEARYVEEPVFLDPYGDIEGIAYGRGEGTVDGDRISGRFDWVEGVIELFSHRDHGTSRIVSTFGLLKSSETYRFVL